jgi:hypothetical protein
MVAPSTQSIVIRRLRSRAERAVRAVLSGLPPRVQRIGFRALTPVLKRWPTLAALLGGRPLRDARVAPLVPRDARAAASRKSPEPSPAVDPRPDGWLRRLKTHPDHVERARAARALGERSGAEVTTALVDALRDPSAEVAAEAADALGRHPAAVAVPALSAVVDNHDGYFNTVVRAAAIRALSGMLPRGEAARIAEAVADVDAEVSIAAIAALVDRREDASTDALLTVVENPHGFYLDLTRGAAARGLRGLSPTQKERVRTVLHGEPEGTLHDVLAAVLRTEEAPRGSA